MAHPPQWVVVMERHCGKRRAETHLWKQEVGEGNQGGTLSTAPHKASGPTSHPHTFSPLGQDRSGAGAYHSPVPEACVPHSLPKVGSKPSLPHPPTPV